MHVIVTHVSSDFDSFAGMIAAKKIYPEAEILMPSSINSNVRRFIALHEDGLPVLKDPCDIDLNSISRIIMVDTKIPSRLGVLKNAANSRKAQIIIFDHHQKSHEDIDHGDDFTRKCGATTTILVNIIKKRKIQITPLEATLFSLGIYEDTGSFTYPGTTDKDLDAASFLKKQGANIYVISKFLNLSLTAEQHKLFEKLMINSTKAAIHEKEIILSCAVTERFVEGLSVLTRKLGQIEDVSVIFCWVKMKDKVYVSARSEDAQVDVSKILEVIGGGGHSQASSAIIKGMEFDEIEQKILAALDKNIKKPVLARDIMSYPVRVVNEDESIASVNELLKKYGHSGIPIVDSGNGLVGIITRKDIDKAIKHGLSHAPVKGFKSRSIVIAGPGATIGDIQDMMTENGIGRVPIVSKGEILGIVTRKDVLRFLHGRDYMKYPEKYRKDFNYNFTTAQLRERLYSLFPESITQILETISGIAREMKVKVYLVGGVVRDLLLGIPDLDIDIVVEGDGTSFARKLSGILAAKVECHEKFKTAILVLENGKHIDVASSRVEYYEKPAALPNVEPGSISQDLARRDFTINTLALSLNRKNFGEIMDFFGGRKDLAAKKIKVLHKMSFIEDPTRIFRAVRFEQRLKFKMDHQTERLAISTIDMNIVSELNGIRIRDEFISILQEMNPWVALKRLYELNALKKIGLGIVVNEALIKQIKKIGERFEEFSSYRDKNTEIWRLILTAMLIRTPDEHILNFCSEMKIKKRDMEIIRQSAKNYESLNIRLGKRISSNSVLYNCLNGVPDELKIIISAISKNHYDNVLRYFTRLKHISVEITGEDLKALKYKPSRNYKIVFDRIMQERLDGKIHTKEEELELAEIILSGLPTINE
jgi:tRNA nucleotidyltransferase (CCA-adding enzyme)